MAPTETKFHLSRIVVSAAVFISLCVASHSAELRRCYWCGPLAEQVHRSERALPCSGSQTKVTVCDPGYNYCAVVATSPPYIESRYCVKLYQDECYSLYCNSTRTWRMTCPCRGDLCNGPNTEREDEAFAGLGKLVARTHNTRHRRALITSGFISMNTERNNRIDNTTVEENEIIPNYTLGNNNNEEVKNSENQINDTITTTDVDKTNIETQTSEVIASTVADVKSDKSQITEASPTAGVEFTNSPIKSSDMNADKVVTSSETPMNETSIQIDITAVNVESSDLKTEIILMSSESTKIVTDNKANENNPDTQPTTAEIKETAKEVKAMVDATTETTKVSAVEIKNNENKVKQSEQFPTAEALQHNETPAVKTTQQTTTGVTSIQRTVTTEASKPRNNTAAQINAHILTLVVGVILQF